MGLMECLEPEQHLSGLNGTKVGILRAFQEPKWHLSGLNGEYNGLFLEPEWRLSGNAMVLYFRT